LPEESKDDLNVLDGSDLRSGSFSERAYQTVLSNEHNGSYKSNAQHARAHEQVLEPLSSEPKENSRSEQHYAFVVKKHQERAHRLCDCSDAYEGTSTIRKAMRDFDVE